VLEKLGMKREGLLRQRVQKWGVFEDVVLMAILHDDWKQMSGKAA
jgi:RimJ/RimL family protein N-acetyltransferase